MRGASIIVFVLATVLAPLPAAARPMSELGGKYKWGMSTADVFQLLGDQLHAKYAELLTHEPDVYKQDQLRQRERDDEQGLRESLFKFDGTEANKSWSASIVQQEFAQHNDEVMIVVSEPNLRRFLFFWRDKLYKQLIALNAEHPAVRGKTFDDFTHVLEDRYGKAEMKFSPTRTHDDMKLDRLEWPATGDYQLFASDQSDFYGNYCLVLFSPNMAKQVEARRSTRDPSARANRNALVDSLTAPAPSSVDRNEDIVDRIIGKK